MFLFQTTPASPGRTYFAVCYMISEWKCMVVTFRRCTPQLNECLLAESRRGKRLVVVIDEAQNLPDSALELLRMLSNFETPREKLMQIVLAGQPQLAEKLASPNLVQLRQRISIVARLKAFNFEETSLYVGHRLLIAGYDFRATFFTPRAGAMIAEHSEGIPRNINNICFNALSLGCALKRKPIEEEIYREVLDDLDLGSEDLGSENEMAMTIHEPRRSAPKAPTVLRRRWYENSRPGMAIEMRYGGDAFVMLMWPIGLGQRDTKVFASQTSPAAATNAAQSSSRILSVSPSALDSQAQTTAAKKSPAPKSPTPETGRSKLTVGPARSLQLGPHDPWNHPLERLAS